VSEVTELEIIQALYRHHGHHTDHTEREWACFDHLRLGTGYGNHNDHAIDFFAMNCWSTGKYKTVGFEVKVSRSDFAREMADPYKRFAAVTILDEFNFVAPAGLLKRSEVPRECGLWEYADGKVTKQFHGKIDSLGKLVVPGWPFLAAVLRRQSGKEAIERAALEQVVE
jgi:hypothetical protein